ncbi:MAG: hypothetical protein ACXIVG_03855 [Pararhodobacter sp.]
MTLGAILCGVMALMPGAQGMALATSPHATITASTPYTVPAGPLTPADQERIRAAMRGMTAAELSLTYARIHTTFRALLSYHDLSAARTLVDYAAVANAEMHRRRVARPASTESPRAMMLLFELVL